jgi:hypothetical protein
VVTAAAMAPIWLKPWKTSKPERSAAVATHWRISGRTFARRSSGKAAMSTAERTRQKRSRPSSISRVMIGPIGSTTAPAFSNIAAAEDTAALISGSTGNPTPASRSRPIRRPSTDTSSVYVSLVGGSEVWSCGSYPDMTDSASAASAAVRVSGPIALPR